MDPIPLPDVRPEPTFLHSRRRAKLSCLVHRPRRARLVHRTCPLHPFKRHSMPGLMRSPNTTPQNRHEMCGWTSMAVPPHSVPTFPAPQIVLG